ncbi:MAG: DUF4271 domain-containing protein, partial [Sphingobacterium sp.]
FKYSEIILYPLKENKVLIGKLDSITKHGQQNYLFNYTNLPLKELAALSLDGHTKTARPFWVLLVVFMLFLLMGVLRIIFPVEIRTIIEGYYKERLLLQLSKEDNLATSWPYIFLYILFSFSLGLFVVLVVSGFGAGNYLTFENFMKNSGFVALLFILKILFIRFVSVIFLLEKIIREYIAILYLIYFNSMFFLMPFLLMVVFVPVSYFKTITIIYALGVTLLFGYRFTRTAIHLFGQFKFSIFYLILYLCSLEVAPVLILVRALNN